MYKYTRKEFLKKVGFLFSKGKILVPNEVDGEELMKLLLAQKEDRKECHCSCHQINPVAFACTECQKNHPTPSPLEGFEEIGELDKNPGSSLAVIDLDMTVNKLIRNQKKLYQYIKEKKI